MPVPNDMWLYCGLSALIVVILCCCFHVTELIKLRYLRKLTSADRFSLSGFSTEFSEGGSSSSTRRNTVVDTDISRATGARGREGNFSIFTVITYAASEANNRPFEVGSVTASPTLNANSSNQPRTETKRSSLEELFAEMSCSTRDNTEGFSGKVNKEDVPPPKYEALFPQL